jgi:aryl-alcohol dehydrogenase-like predicted oxidoreductase
MVRKDLGRTGIKVSAIGFGAYELRLVDEKTAGRLLNAAIDGGVNYIDTAPCYGPSEGYIGATVASRRREYILASKCGCLLGTGKSGHPTRFDRANMLENLHASLKLMKTDHLDVWMLHGAMPEDIREGAADDAIRTLLDAKGDGKVLHVGASFKNGGPPDPRYPAGFGLESMREFITWDVFEVIQVVYGALTRTGEDAIRRAHERGIGIVARGVFKKYTDEYDRLYAKAGIEDLLAGRMSRSEFLIKFVTKNPAVSTAIIGTKDVSHWMEDIELAARNPPLSDETYRDAQARLDRAGATVGGW